MIQKSKNFQLFESILTYAVDETYETQQNDGLFNEDDFFKAAYINRSKKEIELEDHILKNSLHTYFIGSPGTGKTTILRKVLNKIKQDQSALLFLFDIKRVPTINNEANASFEKMLGLLTDLIKSRIENEYINQTSSNADKIDIKHMITFFLERDKKERLEELNNPRLSELFASLNLEYTLDSASKHQSFTEWLNEQLFHKLPDLIKGLVREISANLLPYNYLYYLAHSSTVPRICIIAFDNVDSIIKSENRNAFMKVIRSGFNNYKSSTKIICTIRSKNVVNYSDLGSFIVNEVNLDYSDLANVELQDREIAELDSSNENYEDEKNFIHLKFLRSAKEHFTKSIYEKRYNVFREFCAGDESLDELRFFYELILDDHWLRVAFFDLSNFDRRNMLIEVTNFIQEIVFEQKLDIDQLKLNKPQLEVILPTLFYGWIKKSKKFYEDDIYNIPRDVYQFKKSINGVPKCNLDHLIFCVVFNTCNQSYPSFNFERKASLRRVLGLLSELGYSENQLRERIDYLYKDPATGVHKGLLEFYTSEDYLTAEADEQIALTPRSYYLLVYSSLKYASVFADLREEERINYRAKDFNKYENDLEPVTKPKLNLYLRFLCALGKYHLESLKHIGKLLSPIHGKEWLNYYRRNFCLLYSHERFERNRSGELLFINLLNSNIKFLDRQQDIEKDLYAGMIRRVNHEVISQFKDLKRLYQQEIEKLVMIENYNPSKVNFEMHLNFDVLI